MYSEVSESTREFGYKKAKQHKRVKEKTFCPPNAFKPTINDNKCRIESMPRQTTKFPWDSRFFAFFLILMLPTRQGQQKRAT